MTTETNTLEIVEPAEAQLVEFAAKSGLEQTSTAPLVAAFRPLFAESRKAISDAAGVAESIKDATCVSEIKKARACRLAIRKVRIAGDKIRKQQKANALAYGRAVDGFYNILEADLAPVEKALQDAEDIAERAEQARKDAVEQGRKAALAPFVADVSLYAVRDMAEPAFTALLAGVKIAKEQADAAAKKAEEERIAAENARKAEEARIRAEKERLARELAELEEANRQERLKEQAAREVERQKFEAAAKAAAEVARKEREAIEAKARIEKAEAEAKARKERESAEAVAAKEREARQKAEEELQAQRDAEAKKAAAEALAKRKAAAAGDAEKIRNFAANLRHTQPTLKNETAQTEIAQQTARFVEWLDKKAEAL